MESQNKNTGKPNYKEIEKIAKKNGDQEMAEQAKKRSQNRETTK